jgi:hypothetical protein
MVEIAMKIKYLARMELVNKGETKQRHSFAVRFGI